MFQDTAVTLLAGVTVVEPGAILQIVSEGGGMGFFKGAVDKVNLVLPG